MDTRDAGRRGGFARMRRLTPERLLEISKAASEASVSKRRARRDACRAVTALLQDQDNDLAQLNSSDLEQAIFHATELGRILAGLDVPAVEGIEA